MSIIRSFAELGAEDSLEVFMTVVGAAEHKGHLEHFARAHHEAFNWYVIEKIKSIKTNRLSGKTTHAKVTGRTMFADSMADIVARWKPSPEFADVTPKVAQHAFREASNVVQARLEGHYRQNKKGPKGWWLFRDPMRHRSFGVCGHLRLDHSFLKIQGLPRLPFEKISDGLVKSLEAGTSRISRVVVTKNIGRGPFEKGEDNQWVARIYVRPAKAKTKKKVAEKNQPTQPVAAQQQAENANRQVIFTKPSSQPLVSIHDYILEQIQHEPRHEVTEKYVPAQAPNDREWKETMARLLDMPDFGNFPEPAPALVGQDEDEEQGEYDDYAGDEREVYDPDTW